MRYLLMFLLIGMFYSQISAQLIYRSEQDSAYILPTYENKLNTQQMSFKLVPRKTDSIFSFMIKDELFLKVKRLHILPDKSEFYTVVSGNGKINLVGESYDVTHIHLDKKRKYIILSDEQKPTQTLYMKVDTIHTDNGEYDPSYYSYLENDDKLLYYQSEEYQNSELYYFPSSWDDWGKILPPNTELLVIETDSLFEVKIDNKTAFSAKIDSTITWSKGATIFTQPAQFTIKKKDKTTIFKIGYIEFTTDEGYLFLNEVESNVVLIDKDRQKK